MEKQQAVVLHTAEDTLDYRIDAAIEYGVSMMPGDGFLILQVFNDKAHVMEPMALPMTETTLIDTLKKIRRAHPVACHEERCRLAQLMDLPEPSQIAYN